MCVDTKSPQFAALVFLLADMAEDRAQAIAVELVTQGNGEFTGAKGLTFAPNVTVAA